MRRALMPTFLARRFRQWSLVSSHERGPPMATSMGRMRSSADTADIAELPAEIDDFTAIGCSMVKPMSRAEYRRSYTTERLGDVLRRVAARLAAQREESAAAPQDAAASCPTKRGAAGLSGHVGVWSGVAAPPNTDGDASAARPRRAIGGSKEIRDAALLPQGEVGQKQAPRPHGRLPLFTLPKSSSMR